MPVLAWVGGGDWRQRPSYYLKFNDKLDDERRIDQVVAWLKLPPEERPHFITLYYANVDHAGHGYGPDSEEVRAAVHHLDDMIGELHAKLDEMKLPVDLVVVADHGMVTLKPERVTLSDYADLTNFHTEGSLLYAKTAAEAAKAYAEFQAHPDPRFSVYRRKDVPAALHYDANPREGDPVIVPNGPYEIRARAPAKPDTLVGGHGFDPRAIPEMKAIFFAAGPDVRQGVTLPVFENVNVYPFVAGMLGLKTPEIDGEAESLQAAVPEQEDMPHRIGGSVLAPSVVHMVKPKFSKEARKAKTGGTVLVGLWVGKDGVPSHLRILKSAGNGLDENAIEAVSGYKFRPATENGVPVAVRINIEVNFRIY